MKKVKKLIAGIMVSLVLVSNCVPVLAAVGACPNGCLSNKVLYSSTFKYREATGYHVVQMGTTSVGCTIYTEYYENRYKCGDCGADVGSETVTKEVHSAHS